MWWILLFDGELHLRADAIVGGDEDRIAKSRGLQIEEAAEEPADFGVGARPARCAHQRFDLLDHRIASLDIDAGLGIGHLLF